MIQLSERTGGGTFLRCQPIIEPNARWLVTFVRCKAIPTLQRKVGGTYNNNPRPPPRPNPWIFAPLVGPELLSMVLKPPEQRHCNSPGC